MDTDELWPSSTTVQEWRVTGQPSGPYPFYDFTFRSDREYYQLGRPVRCDQAFIDRWVADIAADWTDVQMQTRKIRTLSTDWVAR